MKGVVIFAVVAIAVLTGLYAYRPQKHGTIIILNGPSAAGKSSIQQEFQSLMLPQLWVKLGIDNLFDKPMPDITLDNLSYWQAKNDIRWVETSTDAEGNNIITLFAGLEGEKVAYSMNSAIAAYANQGCNVIVDYIAYKKEWLEDLLYKLRGIKTIWVKVEIPLHVLEEREAARGTSPKGHARSHYASVHGDISYNLVLHADQFSSFDLAHQLKAFIEHKS